MVPPAAILARDDFYSGEAGKPFSPSAGNGLLSNDASPNPNPQLEVTGHGPLDDPAAGTLKSVGPDGSFLFEPADGWTGTVTFPYTITDKTTGLNATAVAHITISSPAPPPEAAITAGNFTYTVPYRESFTPPEGTILSKVEVKNPSGKPVVIVTPVVPLLGSDGSVSVTPGGGFSWTPPAGGWTGERRGWGWRTERGR